MSLKTASLALIGPGFVAREIRGTRWTELHYVCNRAGNEIATDGFIDWLVHRAFSKTKDGWWCEAAAMGVSCVDNGGLVAGLGVAFDCTKPDRLDDWLIFSEALIKMGFRVTGDETAGLDEIRRVIQSSLAWQMTAENESKDQG